MRTFRTEVQVRGYELDGYGHVNHAVYLNYAEHARWKMLEECEAGVSYFKDRGVSPVVVRVEVDYREPSYLGEYLTVELTLHSRKTRIATFRHRMLKKGTERLAAEVLVTLVVVGAGGKAVSLPEDFDHVFA